MRDKSWESLRQVADAVGISKAHVWELEKERGAKTTFDLAQRFAKHFGVSIDVRVGAQDAPTAEDVDIARVHRDLKKLLERDRHAVAHTIEALKRSREAGG